MMDSKARDPGALPETENMACLYAEGVASIRFRSRQIALASLTYFLLLASPSLHGQAPAPQPPPNVGPPPTGQRTPAAGAPAPVRPAQPVAPAKKRPGT